MSQTKREQVISHIRYLRQELREMHLGIKEDDLFPEPGELRGLMAQLEALLELIEGNTKIQTNSEAAFLSCVVIEQHNDPFPFFESSTACSIES